MALTFGAQQITRPGSYSQVDTSQMIVSAVGSFKALAFIGEAPALQAGTDISQPLTFNSQTTADATTILGAGSLLDNMGIAWRHGADLIYVSVISAATPGAPTTAEWQTAIDKLQPLYVDGIVPITTAGAVIAQVDTHIETMSSELNRKERRGFYGHAKNAAVSAIATLVASAQVERAMFASPAPYDIASDGSKTLYDAISLAAAYAGIWAGQTPEQPLTYKYVDFAGLQTTYSSTDINTLLAAGVAVCEVTRKGSRIVQGITASLSSDLSQKELSVSTLKDVMSDDIRTFLEEKYVGQAGVSGIEITMYNDVISRIEGYKKNNWITSYDPKSVKVTVDGTAYYVEWQGAPTLPINNFLITSHFVL